MLELLQYEHFRKELVNAQCAKFIDEQQILHWQHYSRKRMRLQQALAEQQQQQQQNSTSVKWAIRHYKNSLQGQKAPVDLIWRIVIWNALAWWWY